MKTFKIYIIENLIFKIYKLYQYSFILKKKLILNIYTLYILFFFSILFFYDIKG